MCPTWTELDPCEKEYAVPDNIHIHVRFRRDSVCSLRPPPRIVSQNLCMMRLRLGYHGILKSLIGLVALLPAIAYTQETKSQTYLSSAEASIGSRQLSSLSSDEFSVLGHPLFPSHAVRIKQSRFCDETVK